MRRALISALLLFAALPASAATESPSSQRAWQRIRKARVQQLLPVAMERAKVDAWVVLCRENDNDPLAGHIGGENVGAPAAFLFLKQKDGVRSIALSSAGEAKALQDVGIHDQVVTLDRGEDIFARVAAALAEAKPQRIAVNSSSTLTVADGLSATQRQRLEAALSPALRRRLVSSEELVYEWLSVKLPEEVEIMRRAAAVTAQLEEEAYRSVVPGTTRDSAMWTRPSATG